MNLFSYMDYRQYLKDRYAYEKALNKNFSYRYFARMAGLSSPGFLKMVMNRERNLTPTSINQFSKALKLTNKETDYFEALVLFNQAKTDKERDLYFERLTALKPRSKLTGLQNDQYEYFTKKYFVIIREMVSLPHFRENPAWIGKRLSPKLKPKEVEHALNVLLRLGLIKRNEAGKLVPATASLTTPSEVESMEIFNFHREMLNDAKEAMLSTPSEDRDITALTIPLTKKMLPEFKKRIQSFREEMIDLINKGNVNFDEVYQMNVQLFPVTKTKYKGSIIQ